MRRRWCVPSASREGLPDGRWPSSSGGAASATTIATAALDGCGPEAEVDTARDLLRRRWRADVDATTQARRAMAMLARKGYSPGLSRRLVAEMVDDRGGRRWEVAPGADD